MLLSVPAVPSGCTPWPQELAAEYGEGRICARAFSVLEPEANVAFADEVDTSASAAVTP